MSLLRAWNERKKSSPHRPGRVKTGRLVAALAAVLLFFWLLSGLS